ncbi:MAG: DUF2281 domain-containing protein [Anaerolineae bacterium]|nr:DUF2281 domain-containing protein [Anaerolineae bacterium]
MLAEELTAEVRSMQQKATYPVDEIVRMLPADIRQEVQDFIEFLLAKREKRARAQPGFEWAGALRDLSSCYTSVELQHQILAWRTEPE